jgi:arginyl-tRNA synthetase
MKSIVRKHMSTGSEELPPIAAEAIAHLEPSELQLLRLIPRFEEVLSDAAKAYAPHLVCTYVLDLTQAFNAFYENVSVLNADTQEQKNFRLALTLATSTIVKNALFVLGIDTIEKI